MYSWLYGMLMFGLSVLSMCGVCVAYLSMNRLRFDMYRLVKAVD